MTKTCKFGDLAIYENCVYYFPADITEAENNTFKTQVVYFDRGKWVQDTMIISEEFKNKLQKFIKL